MESIDLYQRLTHRYNPGWRHLDDERYVATVRATPQRLVRAPRDEDAYYDEGTYIMHVRAPAGAPDLRQALHDTLTHSSCRHEYDCCGCQASSARATKISARDYVVRITYTRNY